MFETARWAPKRLLAVLACGLCGHRRGGGGRDIHACQRHRATATGVASTSLSQAEDGATRSSHDVGDDAALAASVIIVGEGHARRLLYEPEVRVPRAAASHVRPDGSANACIEAELHVAGPRVARVVRHVWREQEGAKCRSQRWRGRWCWGGTGRRQRRRAWSRPGSRWHAGNRARGNRVQRCGKARRLERGQSTWLEGEAVRAGDRDVSRAKRVAVAADTDRVDARATHARCWGEDDLAAQAACVVVDGDLVARWIEQAHDCVSFAAAASGDVDRG